MQRPPNRSAQRPHAPAAADSPDRGAPTVLVIDADPVTAGQVAAALPAWAVLHAPDGLTGLDVLRQRLRLHRPIRAAVLELDLPDLSGADTCVLIRQAAPALPILPYTAHATDPLLARALAALGCAQPLAKPAPAAQLAQVLAAAIAHVPTPAGGDLLLHLQHKVAEAEQQLRRGTGSLRVAVACTLAIDRLGVPALLGASGAQVVLAAPPAQLDPATLRGLRLAALATTPPDGLAALQLAQAAGCPLLILAPTAAAGQAWEHLALLGEQAVPLGVVVAQAGDGVARALDALAAGVDYHDPALDGHAPPPPTIKTGDAPPLSAREWQLLALEVYGLAPAAIAAQLGVSRETVYQMRSRLCRRLALADSYALRRWAQARLGAGG